MLSKPPISRYVPPLPGKPAVPYRAAYTVCGASPAQGYWRRECSMGRMQASINGAVQIPSGASIAGYETEGGVTYVRYQICRSIFVQTAPPGPVTCKTYPEQKAEPAVPSTPPRMEYLSGFDWDAGANSMVDLDGDVAMSLTMGRAVGVVVGLCPLGSPGLIDPARVQHGLYFHQSAGGRLQACVIEAGRRVSPIRFYGPADVWSLRRIGGTVSYVHDGDHFYTSMRSSSGQVMVGCAMYATGDFIE
ncbi:TPA: hypothetical protein ACKQDF_000806 [Stenotrophomonas maltophilia]